MDKNKKIMLFVAVIIAAGGLLAFLLWGKEKEQPGNEEVPQSPDPQPNETSAPMVQNPGTASAASGVVAAATGAAQQVPLIGGQPFTGTPTYQWVSKNGLGTIGAVTYDALKIKNPAPGILGKGTAHAGYIYNGLLYLKSTNSDGYKLLFLDFLNTHNLPLPA